MIAPLSLAAGLATLVGAQVATATASPAPEGAKFDAAKALLEHGIDVSKVPGLSGGNAALSGSNGPSRTNNASACSRAVS